MSCVILNRALFFSTVSDARSAAGFVLRQENDTIPESPLRPPTSLENDTITRPASPPPPFLGNDTTRPRPPFRPPPFLGNDTLRPRPPFRPPPFLGNDTLRPRPPFRPTHNPTNCARPQPPVRPPLIFGDSTRPRPLGNGTRLPLRPPPALMPASITNKTLYLLEDV